MRTRIAQKLGYDNFLPVGYARRTRNCYGPKEVAAFRRQVVKDIVPVNNELLRRQHERNGIKNPTAYDRTLICLHGNAAPKDTPEVIFEKGAHMYEAMGEKTGEFFRFMRENQLFDVLSKDGKANGGYCEMLPDYKAPFVFANSTAPPAISRCLPMSAAMPLRDICRRVIIRILHSAILPWILRRYIPCPWSSLPTPT